MAFRVRFQVSLASCTALIVVALTAMTLGCAYIVSSHIARDTAGKLFSSVALGAYEKIDDQMGQTLTLANLGATQPDMQHIDANPLDASVLPFMFTALTRGESLYSVYFGLNDGSFLQVISARENDLILKAHKAPPATHWIVRTIVGAGADRTQTWRFLDAGRSVLSTVSEPQPGYDPRQRPWYKLALGSTEATLSPAYVFDSLGQPGITASKRFANGVFGVDITLSGLDTFVHRQFVSNTGGLILFDASMRVLAMTDSLSPHHADLAALDEIEQPLVKAVAQFRRGHTVTGDLVLTEQDGIQMLLHLAEWKATGYQSIGIAVVAPSEDFMGFIRDMQEKILLLAALCLAVFLAVSLVFARGMAGSIKALAQDAMRIRNMDFSGPEPTPSHIIEFNSLSDAFQLMKATLSTRTHALEEAEAKLSRLVSLGIAMSAERDSNRLMRMILLSAKELANADGATLYIRDADDHLQFRLMANDTLKMTAEGEPDGAVFVPSVPMFDDRGQPNHRNIVSHAVHEKETVIVDDAYDSETFDFSAPKTFDEHYHYRSKSLMTVPLLPHDGEVIGAIQLINAHLPGTEEVVAFPAAIQPFVEALAAQAATALHNHNLEASQERLLDSMIQAIAGAIDAKSPYTGDHCERVPELAMMLAKEAEKQSEGPLAAFHFADDKEWYEFRIAAWLHDCGKMVTPEYIVDKATKLETIYNRIHEVRMRYEVLLRDADIARLQAVLTGQDATAAQAACDATKARLLDDFAFIAECNIGGESLAPEKIRRLEEIARTQWLRHIDDRLGLAHMEYARCEESPAPPLPTVETVLADKPWHVIPRDERVAHAYEGLGFKVKVPKNLYNLGEIYNLSVSRGTLTEEDRFKINEHIMQTIAILERLRFPKNLRRVPEYAGTHHETLTGTGYPRKLDAAHLSIPSRIMAIADIFEALTASDRPYKKAKTLSESIKILNQFKESGQIDPDLFDLFLTSGTYLRYAEAFMTPEQIDGVDIKEYVKPRPIKAATRQDG